LPSGTLPGRWTQTRDLSGAVTGQTLDLSGATLPLSAAGLAAVQAGTGWFETATVQDEPLLIYSRLFNEADGATGIVQVAFPISQPQQYLATLRLMLLAGSSLAVVIAFALGWVMAGTALRPIQRITQTARTIGAERDFGRRVAHQGPADEVGQLAVTFNEMLAELESGYRQLEDALQSQRRFVADASHELRTPLTTVRGNIELLRRTPPIPTEERTEILADTTEEVDRLIRLVNQLLVLARADAGQKLRSAPILVRPLIEDVCRQAKLLTPRTLVQCESPADVMVQGDRDALKQVLLILVDNALVHTTVGTPVTLAVSVAGEQVSFSVRDSGPGIAADVLPHLFERFYRGQASRTGRGAGLGLSIAKELVEAQGGTITVESQPGQGSVFTVILPAATHE
jgi:signal transduction histidine kinase